MWGFIKTIVSLGLLVSLVYLVFFVELGGSTLAGHSRDIWRSPAVQERVRGVRRDVENKIRTYEAKHAAERRGSKPSVASAERTDELSDADRKALEQLLVKALPSSATR